MLKKCFISLFFIATAFVSVAQNYFQQFVKYDIQVVLNDKKHELSAFETIEYTNNSNDTLHYIYFHFWTNAYKNNQTALAKQLLENGSTDFYYSPLEDKGYMDSLHFTIDGTLTKLIIDSSHIDIGKLMLPSPLLPNQTIKISTPFRVKLPKGGFSRLGHIGESYQITQWYPKPAVYDKNGWHPMPYLDQGEFYSEYGTFDVKITLPKNYVVGATGDLINGENELAWLDSIATRTKENIDNISEIISNPNLKFPESSTKTKTLHYHQENVHDFGWFADKRFHVLKGEVELPHSKEKVTTWAMFTNNEADLWMNSIEYLNDAIYYYSLWNGDYPYKHATAVDGTFSTEGGMEYPNVTVIGESYTEFGLETVIMHEIGHNWFYGILGSNERVHPWMDEGLNSLNESRYVATKYPNQRIYGTAQTNGIYKWFDINRYFHKHQYYFGYLLYARQNLDQPMEYPSKDYSYMNYFTIVYGKSAIAFEYLKSYLGEELFDQCMQDYFQKWKFKHPQPEDLKTVFESNTRKNLDWFFDDIINTTKSIDYKIVSHKNDSITIKNKGEISAPFSISAIKNDSIIQTQWFDGFDNTNMVSFNVSDFDRLKIDAQENIPEFNRNNNSLKANGLFKKVEPIRFQFLGSLDNPDKTQLFYTPTLGFNTTDGFMCGLAFYNNLAPQKKFEYIISPMYAFNSKTVVGSGKVSYHLLTNEKLFRQVSINVSANSFTYQSLLGITKPYYKVAPFVDFYLSSNKRKPATHVVSIKGIGINEPEYLAFSATDYNNKVLNEASITSIFGIINYSFDYKGTLKQSYNDASIEINDKFVKLEVESKLDIPFKDKTKGVHFRLFAGSFLFNNSNNPRYNFQMDGTSGFYDYKYEYMQLDRSVISTGLSKLLIENQGGFKVPVSNSSNRWMIALNVKSEIPAPLPLGIFADTGTNSNGELMYDAGLYMFIIRNYFEIYLPLLYSENIKNTLGGKTSFELMRFTLNLNNANPFKLIKEFEF